MSATHDASTQNGIDMANARRTTSVDISSICHLLHNGRTQWETRERIVAILSSDPVFDKSQRHYQSRAERYTRAVAMMNRIYELQVIHNWSQHEVGVALFNIDESLPISLHNIAFQPPVMSQGSPELILEYGPLVANRGIMGCYMQTELGHGSNVSCLETTATYIPETKEFEIHSPTLSSTKWWIGSLAKTSTHGVVQAKLILGGVDHGPHLFFVQLRSLENHKNMPGIVIGGIGPKALGGFAANDHGFARFDHVRIPKIQMLSKFAQVTDDGKYVQPPHAKLSYGGMLYIRSTMVGSNGWAMAKAATVAIRYATVRRQGEKGPDGLERQIITYPSVHIRLLPILSHAYVYIQLGKVLTRLFDAMSSRLQQKDTSLLPEMHAITSGLKITVTTTCIQDIETARRSMGGHGFSAFSGLGSLYADQLPTVTFEGDNFVLNKQVIRAAQKSYTNILKSKDVFNLSSSNAYLRLLVGEHSMPSLPSDSEWQNPATAVLLLEWRAALLVRELAQHVDDLDASATQRTAGAVTEAFIAARVMEMIKELPVVIGDKQRNVKILEKLYLMYLLTTLETGVVDLLSFGVFGVAKGKGDVTRSLRLTIKNLCLELLPEAIGLTDAFGYTDWELDSALGIYDGKVYEQLWRRAHSEPINDAEMSAVYEESIKPILRRGQQQAADMRAKL
ncbi:hypothetical protein AGABI1DRAFT_79987 [Agaricus bisporus var. burnettii JB137-S8]|uniref:Acyl-coenzyme A oxidase n=1 Tax=Agaricus bisporus var. burnettii (strain JB137-S8 / ATCC MYA-4627 / FGSC 10392) TaxID=597362 RepID=K5WJB4_AGABU|nr:uncharacterized protein AGABI1DRAFT_79987 [Agaricus bisporus var. burnettii JB137-S8]EKM75391.1 hypothetical protein AGABI1DRAFT_79987 [Agaricus bisporus var. burnettii JB137-S8]